MNNGQFAIFHIYGILFAYMKLFTGQTQIQRPILAPHMQQSIEILLLPTIELESVIEHELEQNPLLEIDENRTTHERIHIEEIITKNLNKLKEISNINYDEENPSLADEEIQEFPITRPISLEDHLLHQLWFEISDPLKLQIGEFIIGNLDKNGYLQLTSQEIAEHLNLSNTDIINEVLAIIQNNFEPHGIAARNLKECLLIQSKHRFNERVEIICKVIEKYLEELGHKNFSKIARELKLSIEQVKEIAYYISKLDPRPARNYYGTQANLYILADITVIRDEQGEYKVIINRNNIPYLKISSSYQRMLKHKNISKQESDFIRDKIKKAILFIKSIEQRQETLRQIAEYIVKYQKDFLDKGYTALKPMKLKDVAIAINRNQSTVCRAINNKYMDTPQGLFSMKFFFSQSLSTTNEGITNASHISNRSIKEEIKLLIEEEDKSNPISDKDIVEYFKRKNISIARRTIAKYRQALNILPSHLRKN